MATAISVGFFSNFVRLEVLPPHPTPPPPSASSIATARRFRSCYARRSRRPWRLRRITTPRPVSPAMQALVGVPEIPRTQALKLIRAYIKQHDLQDPENKKIIVCDEKLKNLF